MKRQKSLKAILVTTVIAAIVLVACLGLAACNSHEHTYSTTWNSDETNHWHDATCEHTNEKGDLAAHDTNGTDGACSVCGYKAQVTPPAHEHTYATEWSKDETNHWHAATCEHKTEKSGVAKHDTNGTDGACSVCGYKKQTTTPPTHTCGHVCETCGKCTDTCTDPACADKCQGHAPATHTCGHKCETCDKCTDTCTDPACADKCQGHAPATHTCGHVCETCDKCTDTCTDPACADKCQGHAPAHQHSLSGWQKDSTEHYKTCTGENCTEAAGTRFENAAHNTTGTDGACSVCGYSVYDELAAKEGVIIAEKFATPQDRLPDFNGTYGTVGLYSSRSSGNGITTDTHYIKVEGGKAVMVDPGNGETHLVVDFGLTTGKVEGYFEITLKNSGSKWTFIQFVKVGGSEVFGLRSDENNKIIYRLNSTETPVDVDITATSDATYKIYFKFDGATKKISMTINGQDFVKDLGLDVSELGGFRLVSSNSGNKIVELDNLIIVNEATLADLKAVVEAKLQAVYNSYNVATNYTTNGQDVTDAKNNGVTAINAATTKAEIVTAYDAAIAAMKAVESDLAIYKTGKVAELNAHAATKDESNYDADNWTTLQEKVAEGIANINKAADTAAVDAALAAAKEAINAVPDNSAQGELNERDDVEITVFAPDTENAKVFDGTTNSGGSSNVEYHKKDASDVQLGFLTFVKGPSTSNFSNLNKGGYLAVKGGASLKFTTTTDNATLCIKYNGTTGGRKFSIKLGDTDVFKDEEPAAWKDDDGNKTLTKTFTLETAGNYTIVFEDNEHKIETITLTEMKEESVTAKVNKVEATVVETATAGVEVANLVSKVFVQLDHEGEMIPGEITEKDQYTVIVKNSDGVVVDAETLAEGTYTVIVVFGSGKTESNATQYNSHSYTVTVTAAAETGEPEVE